MFDTFDYASLRAGLDCYPVPMFAAERRTAHDPFRLICVNASHTRVTGLKTSDIHLLRPTQVLSRLEGEAVETHYNRCADSGKIRQYREAIHFYGRLTHWETTLLPVPLGDGTCRLIGTALTLGLPVTPEPISDAEFYAAQAQQRLGHIHHFLEMLNDREDVPHDIRANAEMIAGLNRSVDHLMHDLRHATRAGQDTAHPADADLHALS